MSTKQFEITIIVLGILSATFISIGLYGLLSEGLK